MGKGDMAADCLLLFKLDTDPAYCRLLLKLDTDPVYESGREEVFEKEEDLRCIIPSSDTTVAAGEKREEPRLGIDMESPTGALFGGCIVVVMVASDSASSDMVARWADFVTTVREVEADAEAEELGEVELLLEGEPVLL